MEEYTNKQKKKFYLGGEKKKNKQAKKLEKRKDQFGYAPTGNSNHKSLVQH